MITKIENKIVDCEIVTDDARSAMTMTPYDRPAEIAGITYKIKPPTLNAALYITINDITLDDGARRPMEIFLNSKDVTHSQWMVAVSRLLSALFRQPLQFEFAINELQEVIDPKGSYFIPGGGGQCGGIVAHIGKVIEQHCRKIGALSAPERTDEEKAALDAKKDAAEKRGVKALLCSMCHEQAVYSLDGCLTCTSCGDSKCV